MQVAERLVEILEENGITHIFGIPGEQIMPMYRALSKSDIRHVLTRQEPLIILESAWPQQVPEH